MCGTTDLRASRSGASLVHACTRASLTHQIMFTAKFTIEVVKTSACAFVAVKRGNNCAYIVKPRLAYVDGWLKDYMSIRR